MMQVTEYQGKQYMEIFEASTQEELIEKMDKRLAELKGEDHELVERKPVFRNRPCPCGSNKKAKYCCLTRKK